MEILWHKNAWQDYQYWKRSGGDELQKVNLLLKQCIANPFSGKGNPRQLKGVLNNYWSRRIDNKNRIIYKVLDGKLVIIQCKFH